VNHYNVQPVFDVYANVDRQDLGSVGSAVEKIMDDVSKRLPRGTSLAWRGQVSTMRTSFYRLELGLIFAVTLVYLLMAVNFQSWLDPFINPDGSARRFCGNCLDAVRHPDHIQRALLDGQYHEHWGGHRKQHSAGGLWQ